jgi:hypothetical protein
MRVRRLRGALLGLGVVVLLVGQSVGAVAGPQVVLWNHLNGPWSVRHSVVGEDFRILGSPVFRDGVSGRAIGVVDDESLLLMPRGDFFGESASQGTVSLFLKKRMPRSVPYQTPLAGVFGAQPYDFQDAWCQDAPKNPGSDSCTNYAVAALWGDGLSGPAGLYLQVVESDGTVHQIVDRAFNTKGVPVGTWIQATFVWDIDGIGRSADTMRIYRNGGPVASTTEPIADVVDLPTPVAFAGGHAASRLDGPALLMDELIVLDRAVTP